MGDNASLEKDNRASINPGGVSLSRIAQRVLVATEGIFCTVAAIALVFMAAYIGVGIVGRYVFNHPFPAVWDSITLLIVMVVFLSLAYTQRVGRHIKVTVLVDRLSPNIRNRLSIANLIIGFVFFAVVSWQSWILALESLAVREYYPGLLNLPVYPSKLALAVGISLLSIRYLVDAVVGLRRTGGQRLNR